MPGDGITIRYQNKYSLEHDIKVGWMPKEHIPGPIPLFFEQPLLDRRVRELTDLSETQAPKRERVAYLGWRPQHTFEFHRVFSPEGYEFIHFHLAKNKVMADFMESHYPDFKYGGTRIFTGMNPTMTS
jgi:hypothetical protein